MELSELIKEVEEYRKNEENLEHFIEILNHLLINNKEPPSISVKDIYYITCFLACLKNKKLV